ncbi:MAG: carboxypeptidase-like regulatory domain-containing protein, partial [Acidobacteria bacterium]|nr:carboxypeptidase-like regulatory domain-containing protein [Acidobacteriota bacterium]
MLRLGLLLALFVLTVGDMLAQVTTASLVGTVQDASRGVVPGATVKAKALATNQLREVKTDPDGNYILTNLPIGAYEVTISVTGFRTE